VLVRHAFAFAFMAACGRSTPVDSDASAATKLAHSAEASISSWPAPSSGGDAAGPARPGMAWIPAGVLRAGTPRERTPRVADEEMAARPVEMGGFYIDLLPWPNEPNAIPTTNVSRDEAEQLCATKGKRLCTELEWERACKGPGNTTYEYGETYRKDACGTGVAIEQASRRPTGEHAQCRSAFTVAEMHGGVFEWTASVWGRGSRDGAQGVLRGGNSVAGELVGRCANAIARSPSKKAPTMGLRCCAGPKSSAEVALDLHGTPSLVMANPTNATPWVSAIATAVGNGSPTVDPKTVHAWTWIPVANEELVIALGCTSEPRGCGLVVARPSSSDAGTAGDVLAAASSGKDLPEVARNGDPRHLRFRSLDQRGVYQRDITYAYGRIELGASKRP
jgi:formylglycine-generating enzyme